MPSSSSAMKVNELKEELKRRGLPTNGLKANLLARLQAAEEEEEEDNNLAKRAKVSAPTAGDFSSIENLDDRVRALLDCLCSSSKEGECERALKYCHKTLIAFSPALRASSPYSLAMLLIEMDGVGTELKLSKRRERLNQVYFEHTGNLPARNTDPCALITEGIMSKEFYHQLVGRETEVEDKDILVRAANHYINPKVHVQANVATVPEFLFTSRNAHSFQHLKSRLQFLGKLELLTSQHSTQRPKTFSPATTAKAKFYLNQVGDAITLDQTPASGSTAPLINKTDVLLATKLTALDRINDCDLLFPAHQPLPAAAVAASTSDEVVDLCLTSKLAYVHCNANEALLSETVSKLLTRNTKARVLVVSTRANKLQRVALQALKLGKLSALDIISCDENSHDFAPAKCIARFEKQRLRALDEYIVGDNKLLYPDFRTARAVLPPSATAAAEDFALFELFSHDNKLCTEYLVQTRCRLVLSTAEAVAVATGGAFDYILLDECTSQLDFLVYSNVARATRAIVCFGAQPACDFPVHKQMTYTSAPIVPAQAFSPGFACAVQVVQCASVKEEAEFAMYADQFASRLVGYDDVTVCAWTEKQCELVDDVYFKQNLLAPGCLFASSKQATRSSELVLMCSGGSTFSQEEFEQIKLRFAAVIVFACNATWKPTHGLQLVLAERVGEGFDEELRNGSLHTVTKPQELRDIISSL